MYSKSVGKKKLKPIRTKCAIEKWRCLVKRREIDTETERQRERERENKRQIRNSV